MSKIIEKIVYKRVSNFLDSNTFFTNRQFGFRKHMSTSHAITLLVDSISKNMNRKNKTLGLFLDLSRAFDLIDHEILLYKLNHYGFRGISNAWFRSYLSNRTQQVEVDSLLSDNVCGIRFGTPQGSILAPLLFLIFINDLPNCLEHSEPLLFADDTNLLITHKNCHDLIRLGNLELANIQTYMNCNKLLINTDKTKAIIFHTPSTQIPNNLGNLNLSGEKIDIIKETKFLGLKIHEKLSWKTHMLDIKSTLRKNTAICSKIKNQLNPKAFVDLYHTMIECHIRYGITSWCFGNMTIKNSLQRSCNRFLKMALKCPDHLLSEKMKEYKILSIDQIFLLEIGLAMFKLYNNSFPTALTNLFTPTTTAMATRSRSRYTLSAPRIQLTKQSFNYKGPTIWNKIPDEIKYSNRSDSSFRTFKAFKTRLKSHILNMGITQSSFILNQIYYPNEYF